MPMKPTIHPYDADHISKEEMKSLLLAHEERIMGAFDRLISHAVKATLVENGEISRYISKQAAYKLYGRTAVDRWISKGILKEHKDADGSARCRIDRFELDQCAGRSNHPAIVHGKIRTRKTKTSNPKK